MHRIVMWHSGTTQTSKHPSQHVNNRHKAHAIAVQDDKTAQSHSHQRNPLADTNASHRVSKRGSAVGHELRRQLLVHQPLAPRHGRPRGGKRLCTTNDEAVRVSE